MVANVRLKKVSYAQSAHICFGESLLRLRTTNSWISEHKSTFHFVHALQIGDDQILIGRLISPVTESVQSARINLLETEKKLNG